MKTFLSVCQGYKDNIAKLIKELPSTEQDKILDMIDDIVYEYKHTSDCGRAMDNYLIDKGFDYPSARVMAEYIEAESHRYEDDYSFEVRYYDI